MAPQALIAGVTDAASGGSRIMPNESTPPTAVVVGATGIIGRAIATKLPELGRWRVIGITRSGSTVPGVDEGIAVDLRDPEEARRRLAPAAGATHLFFAAYLPQASFAAEVGPNRFMFAIEYDIVLALGKIRRAGFVRHPETLEGFYRRFDDYRRARIIPTF
jgi:hypothetical protein